jgi:uncharacterized protein (DUF486 family)
MGVRLALNADTFHRILSSINTKTLSRTLSSITSRCYQHSSLFWKVIFLAELAVVCYLSFVLSRVMMGGGATYSEFHNSYCQGDNSVANNDNIVLNGSSTAPCAYDYNFKKILYFWCDGIAFDRAETIFNHFPDNSNIFKVRHKENPWSAWVWATFMTGKAERNMGEVKNDNLIYQFYLAGQKAWLGAKNDRSYVFGQLDTKFQHGEVSYYPSVKDDELRMFHWLFECPESTNPSACTNYTLDRAKEEDRSMWFESFILDHRVHETNTKDAYKAIALRDRFAADIPYVKQWVDDNPEYLLVVVSDHGQKMSNAEVEIHGNWLLSGNEAWMMIYNPNLQNPISRLPAPIVLNTVDVAPTLWQFFSASGASIPAESVGKVVPVTTSTTTRYKTLHTNAMQLRKYNSREKVIHDDEVLWHSAITNYENGLYEQAVIDMDAYISTLSDQIVLEGTKLPLKLPIATALIALVATLIIQFGSREGLIAAARSVGFGVLAGPYLTWIIIVVFFTQSSDFPDRNQVYTYAVPMLAYLASYTLKLASKSTYVPQKKGHRLLTIELGERSFSPLSKSTDSMLEISDGDETSDEQSLDLKSTGTDTPASTDEEKQYLYFEIYDNLRQRRFKEALMAPVNYIFGTHKVPKSAADFWLMYAVVVFAIFSCFEISFVHKRLIWGDISGMYSHPQFYNTLALAVLFMEFRWQRALLTSSLELPAGRFGSFVQQIIHPAFWPLNIKTIVYFVMLHSTFVEWKGDIPHDTALNIYYVTFAHIGLLVFSPTYLQRDLFLPLFILSWMINSSQEKILLCMYAIIQHFLSNTLERPNPKANRHVLPVVFFTMIALGHYYFSILYQLPYSLDQMNLTVPGIDDVTKYPNFSVMMMGLHYLGVFLLLIPFMIRLTVPGPPLLRPFKIGKYFCFGHVPVPLPPGSDTNSATIAHNRRFIMTLLVFCSSLSVFLYYVFSVSERTDTPLIWAFMVCAVTIGFGVMAVCHEFVDVLFRLLKFLKELISARMS